MFNFSQDPLFTVPTFKDFMKAANCAAKEAAEIVIQTNRLFVKFSKFSLFEATAASVQEYV